MVASYEWPLVSEFLDRSRELTRLESWWDSPERQPIALIGRRRVGKTWLFRRFAHGKPAVILVAEQLPPGSQLTRFAEALEPVMGGVTPALANIASLFRTIYRLAREQKCLVVIDEFPWLLGTSESEVRHSLTSVQAVVEEERDHSKIKLILCGSQVGQMEGLFSERSPMHGRLIRMDVRALDFQRTKPFIGDTSPLAALERFSIAGGMPLYLTKLAKGSLRSAVSREILDRDGPLWNEGRSILDQELREPRVYFAILEVLAGGEKELNEIAQSLRMEGGAVAKYLSNLTDLEIVRRRLPIGARTNSRSGHWRLEDLFLRFWFRFVFPFQNALETGLRPQDLYDAEVAPALSDHVSPVFEDWSRSWLLSTHGSELTEVGAWWGKAANEFRRRGIRSSEEIDAVGTRRSRITLLGECKWTTRPMTVQVVKDLDDYKIPAIRDAGLRIAESLRIVLFSKVGYTRGLQELAKIDRRIELVNVEKAMAETRI